MEGLVCLRIRILGICFILVFLLVGCTKLGEPEITSIKLVCADLCNDDQENPEAPFVERTFEDTAQLRIFERAMDKAEKMSGEIEYVVYFRMYVSYEDGSQKEYVLNISSSEKEGITGLLVDSADSGQGYTIPEAQHNELRTLIYDKKSF